MKHLIIFAVVCCAVVYGADVRKDNTIKILILTSKGGQGHTSATKALREYFPKNGYQIQTVNFMTEVLGSLDTVKKIADLFDRDFDYEELYNMLLGFNQHTVIGLLNSIGQLYLPQQNQEVFQLITNYMKQAQPDLVISVEPLYNAVTAQVMQKLGIPFWVIPTDFDASMFAQGFNIIEGDGCYFNIPLKNHMVMDKILDNISRSVMPTFVGMPIRTQFLQKYDSVKLKEALAIPSDKTVVMVMLGGRGSTEMVDVAQELAKVKGAVHFLFCIGKAPLEKQLQEIIQTAGMSATIVPFTEQIAQYMACADLFITKSGGQTVAEALYMQLPMVIDARSKALPWEELNRSLVINNGYGDVVFTLEQYAPKIQEIVNNPERIARWKQNIQKLNLVNPQQEVLETVKRIFMRQAGYFSTSVPTDTRAPLPTHSTSGQQ